MSGRQSLRKAIDATCKSCIYDELSGLGTWREQIARCTCTDCPLWPVRTGPEAGPYRRAIVDEIIRHDPGRAHLNGA